MRQNNICDLILWIVDIDMCVFYTDMEHGYQDKD